MKSWQTTLTVLKESGFLKWDSLTNVVLIVNALRYQSPENPNQTEAALRRIKDLPNTPLLQDFLSLALDHCCRKGATPAAQAFAELLRQQLPNSCRTFVPTVDEHFVPLNLKPPPQPKTKPQSESESPRKAEKSRIVSTKGRQVRMDTDSELEPLASVMDRDHPWLHRNNRR
jgi:hypothetical protein